MKHVYFFLVALVGLWAPSFAEEMQAKAAMFARADGDRVRLALEIRIDKGWHLYSGPTMADVGPEGVYALPTELDLTGDGFTWGAWRFPEPEIEVQDFGTPLDVHIHRGTIVVHRVGKKSADAKLESLKLKIKGQTCSDGEGGTCVDFKQSLSYGGAGDDKLFASFPTDLTVDSPQVPRPKSNTAKAAPADDPKATGASASGATRPASGASGDDDAGQEKDLLPFLISAVFWGLFTLLMPCTYPMIPITISYFTKQAQARKSSTLPLSLAYGAGIVLIFVLIGITIGPLIIPFATHPVTNLIIGGFFVVFALSLFGVLTLQPPAFLLNAAGSASQKGGYLGVFLMGATLVITSFTCTAPFVGTLLSTGASSGGLGRIALGMAVFGLTMAVPFVFLSMVPGKVKSIPKSGEWMHTLKVYLGFVEIAAALKFLSNADLVWNWQFLSRELFLVQWGAIFLCASACLFGWVRLRDEYGQEEAAAISPKRMIAAVGNVMLAVYFFLGAAGHEMDSITTAIAPNYSSKIGYSNEDGGTAAQAGHVVIKDDFDAALERAKSEGKLLLANFTGFTCVNCRKMEEKVFPLPSVSKELREHFIEARLHTDGGPSLERNLELREKYTKSVANPYYVVIDPNTGERLRKKAAYIPEPEFLKFLRGGGID